MTKLQNLQQALNSSTGKTATPSAAKPASEPPAAYTAPSRAGRANITAYLHPDFKASMRLVQARKGGNISFQTLIAEALNDLFTKYDVPVVMQD